MTILGTPSVRRPSTRDADRGRRRAGGDARASRTGATVAKRAKRATIAGEKPASSARARSGGLRGAARSAPAARTVMIGPAAAFLAAPLDPRSSRSESKDPGRELASAAAFVAAVARFCARIVASPPASGPAIASHAPGSTHAGRGNLRLKARRV